MSGLKTLQVFVQRLVIHIFRIVFNHRHNRIRCNESCEVIDMAMRIVAGNSFSQPDDVLRAEIFFEKFFVVGARHAWIALLNFSQQTFFGRKHGTASVHIDGTAFQNDAVLIP